MKIADNQSIWQESYWTLFKKLLSCVTINSPVEFLEKPSENEASNGSNFQLLLYQSIIKLLQLKFRFDLKKANVTEIFLKVHSKDMSTLNQRWGLNNLFLLRYNRNSSSGQLWKYVFEVNTFHVSFLYLKLIDSTFHFIQNFRQT